MMKTDDMSASMTIRLPKEQLDALRQLSRQTNVNYSVYVRQGIEIILKRSASKPRA